MLKNMVQNTIGSLPSVHSLYSSSFLMKQNKIPIVQGNLPSFIWSCVAFIPNHPIDTEFVPGPGCAAGDRPYS